MSGQDQFDSLLETLKNGAYLAGTIALGAAGAACEQAEKLAEAVRLRYQAARVEGEMDGKLMEAGEMVYATHTGNPTESGELLEKLQEIDVLKAQLAALNETLGRKPEDASCPGCGEAVEEGDRFCRFCGEKLN